MRVASLLTALTGLAVAGGTTYLARDYLTPAPVEATREAAPETVPVIVAKADIGFGQAIEAHMLNIIEWPADAAPAATFTSFDQLLPSDGQGLRRAKRPFSQGDIILAPKVSDFGEKVTITQTLDPSRRAMALTVNAQTSAGGFVTPGDFVDIVLTRGGGGGLTTHTIMQNVRVIAVDQMSDENNDNPMVARTVTVDVSPDEAQRLSLAQSAGRLSLTLRSFEETEDAQELEAVSLVDLLDGPVVDSEGERQKRVRIRRGTELSDTILN
ncbi:Flp pilus assembly protein CpaB [Jannaschia seohaensis]|uniref:Pilus assembly protein CpaB n=1 Tax=Jannaschia seohaensis TaxID=475081 RepID=A0A2Y9ALZ3_9RHOB|nr:Flp pilus assembly protein CpaB [Jannaschia seohaensis]PWJ20307.1 pilus assembly protein CpaB [Jannaschia seohaensis]SSA44338.1 pilus assembly protein CpaB [Jannaschia seohaensis]